MAAFRRAIAELGITAPLYLTQNDGTLMSAEFAERYPVLTFASGPTNSMRGAAFLSGLKDAMVVDIGGTTADVGALTHGFPREASVAVDIGGVRTNFRMPDVYSFGLGGGSHVAARSAHDRPAECRVPAHRGGAGVRGQRNSPPATSRWRRGWRRWAIPPGWRISTKDWWMRRWRGSRR